MSDLTAPKMSTKDGGRQSCENLEDRNNSPCNTSHDNEIIVIGLDEDEKTSTAANCAGDVGDDIMELNTKGSLEELDVFVSTGITLTMPVWDETVDCMPMPASTNCFDKQESPESPIKADVGESYVTCESNSQQMDSPHNQDLDVNEAIDDTVRCLLEHLINQLDDTRELNEENLVKMKCVFDIIPQTVEDGHASMLNAGEESDDDIEILLDKTVEAGNKSKVAFLGLEECTKVNGSKDRCAGVDGGVLSNRVVNLEPEGPLKKITRCDGVPAGQATIDESLDVSRLDLSFELKIDENLIDMDSDVTDNKEESEPDLIEVRVGLPNEAVMVENAANETDKVVLKDHPNAYEVVNIENESTAEQKAIINILLDKVACRDRKIVELEAEFRKLDALLEYEDSEPPSLNDGSFIHRLQKKTGKVVDLNATVKNLEESVQKISVERDDMAATLHQTKKDLSELRKRFDEKSAINLKLAAELEDTLKVIDAAKANDQDKEERIAMLELDISYARDQVKLGEDDLKRSKEKLESQMQSIREELICEKEVNKNLRHNLKEEMKQRIRELKVVTESEKDVFVKQVTALQEKEVDYLRKLDELRTNNEEQTRQTRDLKADVKAKNMEVEAYRCVAEKLRIVVARLEKENVRFDQKIKNMHLNPSDKNTNSAPEVITIDTDDPESDDNSNVDDDDDDEECLENIRQFQRNLLYKSKASPSSNKRSQDSEEDTCMVKRLRVAGQCLPVAVVAAADTCRSTKATVNSSDDKTCVAVIRSTDQVEDLGTSSMQVTPENVTLEGEQECQEVGIEIEMQAEEASSLPGLNDQQTLLLRLQSEMAKVINARNRLEPLLSSLSEELHAEKSRVELLTCRLQQRAVVEKGVLEEQQNQLAELLQRVKDVEAELQERNAAVHRLEAEKEAIAELNGQLKDEVRCTGEETNILRLEQEKHKEIASKFDIIKGDMQAVLKERDLLQQRVLVLESGQEGLQDLRDKNDLLHAELSVALAEQERLNALLSKLEEESLRVLTLEQSVAELKVNASDAAAERNELVAKLAQRQQEVEKIMDACKQTILMADTERTNFRKQCQESVEASERTTEVLRTEVSEIMSVNVDLQEQLKIFRCKLGEAEARLSEKTATITVLKSELDVFRLDRDSAKGKIESLCEEVVATKKTLTETEKKLEDTLNAATSLKKRMKERRAMSNEEKEQLLENMKSKVSSIEVDLCEAVASRINLPKERATVLGDHDKDIEVMHSSIKSACDELKVKYEEAKRCTNELEMDVLKNVSSFAEVEKFKEEVCDGRKRFYDELRQLREESKTASVTRENLHAELEYLKTGNETLLNKIRSMEVLSNRVQHLTTTENELSRGISKLEVDLMQDDALENKVVNFLKVDLDDAQKRLTRVAAVTDDLRIATLYTTTQEISMSEHGSSNNDVQAIMNKKVSMLTETIDALKASKETLQNRLNLALANGRRMETLLQSIQRPSASAKKAQSEIGAQLEAVQRERDDLIRKLAESDTLGKRLKVKVINLGKAIKKIQGDSCDEKEIHVVNFDEWERFANGCASSSSSHKPTLPAMERTTKPAEEANERSGDVQLPAKLSRQTSESNSFKENELGDRRRLPSKGQVQSVASTRSVDENLLKSVDNQREPLNAKRAGGNRINVPVAKKALNTITNETPHSSSLVVQDQPKRIQPIHSSDGSHASEDCAVQ